MSNNIRVVLVDDHPLLLEGVAATLTAETDFEVVGKGCNADEALSLALDLLPDLILLDVSMEGGGIRAARAIASACPIVKIIMLTVSEDEDDVLAALKAGARGYILKGVSGPELVQIVRAIYTGQAYVTPALAASLLGEWRPSDNAEQSPSDPLSELTPRERGILELVSTGKSNKEVAQELFLSEKTIKHYMTNILQKLQVRNRVEAALLARQATES
ncbi:LuxR C-terminal-related transcriptional regulator [Sedimenticola sp.]|uniref:LuxR C-terminal-related transcriptional regulator n=1 Tax=Sedimenticola sp. TaxID=1940285 RepID=UPI003D108597